MTNHPFEPDAPRAPLSTAGRARREAMLKDLQLAVVSAARRRRAARIAAIAAPPAVALIFAFTYFTPTPTPARPGIADNTSTTTHADSDPAPAPPAAPRDNGAPYRMANANFEIISTPPGVQIVTSATPRVQTISDDELLDLLRSAGRDVGLIRTPTNVILTDNRPEDSSEPSSKAPPDQQRTQPFAA